MTRRTLTRLAVLVMVGLMLLTWLAPRARRWLQIDRCLDAGGRWNYDRSLCEG